ncbi:MAG: DUF1559 domain-containing protein [Planctomycetaceae bacterium]|nr:DUF1559 domain-containing protein [Planctomycetaceae bacterium]
MHSFPPQEIPWNWIIYFTLNSLFAFPMVLWTTRLLLFRQVGKNEEHETISPRRTKSKIIGCVIPSISIGTSLIPCFFYLPFLLVARFSLRSYLGILLFITFGSIICGMLLRGLPEARGPAIRTQCRNNLKQIGIAVHSYHEFNGQLPSPSYLSENYTPTSWRVYLLPYMGATDLWKGYDSNQTWDSPANASTLASRPSFYNCAAVPDDETLKTVTHYAVVTGQGTVHPPEGPLTLTQVQEGDGTSNTIYASEVSGVQIPWTEPRDIDVDKLPLGINLPGKQRGQSEGTFSSYHKEGAFFLMCDGSVQLIDEDIDPQILKALTTTNGNEHVNLYDLP